jgi:hypothetical protein
MMSFRTMRELGMEKGASLSKEIVLEDSGPAGEVAAGVGRAKRATFSGSWPSVWRWVLRFSVVQERWSFPSFSR